jgi:D-lactate dehydrogenase (cytochrome)
LTEYRPPSPDNVPAVVAQLSTRFGERLVTALAIRNEHGRGEGLDIVFPPDAVVFPTSTAEVAEIIEICAAAGVAVIPFGAGTSLEGHVQAIHGGVCIDMSRMSRILAVNREDLDCVVEAGVTREQLNHHLRDQGLFFPLDPGANASLGGMAATRASGTNAVRYGTMAAATLGLTVVTSHGQIIRTGSGARKSSTGYDLTRLYIGSEGTLGIITELRLRLHGIPECLLAATCQFDSLDGAVGAVTLLLQAGAPVARIELLDDLQMRACIAYSKLQGLDGKTTLFLEFHGGPAAVEEQIAFAGAVCAEMGGGEFRWARAQEERSQLWQARHNAYHAGRALAPRKEAFATDACVPISMLASSIRKAKDEAMQSGLICPIVGHVGDGNFHVLVLFDPADGAERARAEALSKSISRRAIESGGTCSGEHGVGVHKLALMQVEHGPAIEVMRAIKQALDPKNIMNPGKTIPYA